jgi:KUP system potassium uptake protein
MAGCIGMVLHFRESTKMEAAFGLSVTLTMLMSTILINFYLHARRVPMVWVVLITGLFLAIELSFLAANLQKVKEGGYITLVIGALLFLIMYIWRKGRRIANGLKKIVSIEDYIPLLKRLSLDEKITKYATNLVYLTSSGTSRKVEKTAIDSILSKSPKRADIYWFVHVNVLDEPYAMRYHVDTIVKDDVYFIEFNLGFRIEPRIDYYFRQVVNELVETGEVDVSNRSEQLYQESKIGDFRFLVMESFLSYENDMPFWKNIIMKSYFNLKYLAVKESINFGLDPSNVKVEKYPVVVNAVQHPPLVRQ